MQVTTNRGQTFDVNWAWEHKNGPLMIELKEERNIGEIADDFDGLARIERKSEEEGDATYSGFDVLVSVTRNRKNGTVLLTLERSAANA